jgi:hypothetical protein
MAKTATACPFSNKACTECGIYRGRHHHRSFSGRRQDCADKRKDSAKANVIPLSAEFRALKEIVEPCAGKRRGNKAELKIRLKVIDVERNETRVCDLHELGKWDWSNPQIWRIIDGWQITSLDRLIEILHQKAEAGDEEVELYEAPRFMLLAGG